VCGSSPSPSAAEQRLVGILAKLLGVDQVGVDENFLLLGGDSLLGIQVINQVREAFAVELPLHTLFEAPTVAELSAQIDRLLLEKAQATREGEAERILASNAVSKVGDL
jgi:iturin family lipopeptide synthetase A